MTGQIASRSFFTDPIRSPQGLYEVLTHTQSHSLASVTQLLLLLLLVAATLNTGRSLGLRRSAPMQLDGPVPTDRNHADVFCLLPGADKSFPRPVVTPEDLVVLRNEEATLHCQFTAVPPPTLEWYHEAELLANKSRYVERRITPSPQNPASPPLLTYFFFLFPIVHLLLPLMC